MRCAAFVAGIMVLYSLSWVATRDPGPPKTGDAMGLARKVHNLLSLMGLDFVRLGRTFAATPRFIRDARRYKRALAATQNGSPATASGPGAPAAASAAAGKFAMHW